jgi:hypothetical protein
MGKKNWLSRRPKPGPRNWCFFLTHTPEAKTTNKGRFSCALVESLRDLATALLFSSAILERHEQRHKSAGFPVFLLQERASE